MAWPGDHRAVAASGRGYMRASDADRERVVDTLKAAFAQGRLTKDEFDARIGQTLASRTYAELATVTAGIPPPAAGSAGAAPGAAAAGEQRSQVGHIRDRYAGHCGRRFRVRFHAW